MTIQNKNAEQATFNLTLSRWHNVAKRMANLASEASQKALAGFGGARVDGFAGDAQISALKARRVEAQEGLALALALQDDIGAVREAIGLANARTGVAALLARQESINRSAKLLRELIDAQKPGMVPIDGLAAYKPISQGESRYFRGGEDGAVAVGLMDENELLDLKKRVVALQAKGFSVADQINDLNREKISVAISRQTATLIGLAEPQE